MITSMQKKFFVGIIFLVLSFGITLLLTMFQKVEVTKHSDLNAISCGWPLKFVVHDDSLLDPPMPWEAPCGFLRGYYGQGSTKAFYWQYFIFDTAFFYLVLLVLLRGRNLIREKG